MTKQGVLIILSWAALGVSSRAVGDSGLQVEVTRTASCQDSQKAQNGDKVTVHYGGFLQDGKHRSVSKYQLSLFLHVKQTKQRNALCCFELI